MGSFIMARLKLNYSECIKLKLILLNLFKDHNNM